MALFGANHRNDEDDEIDEQPKDRLVLPLGILIIAVVLIIPIGMIFTGRGDDVFGLLLLLFRLFLIALPLVLLYYTIKLVVQKRRQEARRLAIVTLITAAICLVLFVLLIFVTIQ
jgi:uncharacterized membrane-anchored protein